MFIQTAQIGMTGVTGMTTVDKQRDGVMKGVSVGL